MNNLGERPSPAAFLSSDTIDPHAGENARNPRGWHKRGFLPHCDLSQLHQMITYRLADSLPLDVAQRLDNELDDEQGESLYRKRIETLLDAGHGQCVLRRPEIAQIVIDAWNHIDGLRYDLHAWVVMPNHVHVLIAMRQTSLSDIVHAWKSFTARKINAALGRTGKLWQEDYWDRYIRNATHYAAAVEYILSNPGPRTPGTSASSLGARPSSPAWYRDAPNPKNTPLGARPSPAASSLDTITPPSAGVPARAPKRIS